MICDSKGIFKNVLYSYTNTHHDVTDFEVEGIVRKYETLNISKIGHDFTIIEKNPQIMFQRRYFQQLLFSGQGDL